MADRKAAMQPGDNNKRPSRENSPTRRKELERVNTQFLHDTTQNPQASEISQGLEKEWNPQTLQNHLEVQKKIEDTIRKIEVSPKNGISLLEITNA